MNYNTTNYLMIIIIIIISNKSLPVDWYNMMVLKLYPIRIWVPPWLRSIICRSKFSPIIWISWLMWRRWCLWRWRWNGFCTRWTRRRWQQPSTDWRCRSRFSLFIRAFTTIFFLKIKSNWNILKHLSNL